MNQKPSTFEDVQKYLDVYKVTATRDPKTGAVHIKSGIPSIDCVVPAPNDDLWTEICPTLGAPLDSLVILVNVFEDQVAFYPMEGPGSRGSANGLDGVVMHIKNAGTPAIVEE